ncbi:MAG: transposase, partial [Chloroflexota bacterium]|nr:transposase [Chloroflexota bacterium]
HWSRIASLLPPVSATGRPTQDHRRLLAGMLWAMQAGATWRETPERFGSWHTIYTRYRDWQRAGLWSQIVAILNAEEGPLTS